MRQRRTRIELRCSENRTRVEAVLPSEGGRCIAAPQRRSVGAARAEGLRGVPQAVRQMAHRVCARDVRLLQTLGFGEADAVEALRCAPVLPAHHSRVESAAHLLCLSPGTVERAAARASSPCRSTARDSPLSCSGNPPFPGTYASPPSARMSSTCPVGTGRLESERRRLHELLVTTPPEQIVRSLRDRILHEDAEGARAVETLSELFPTRGWAPRWT
jgi:hypothetical protein